jgi:signal transduction histidine kinase
MIQALRKKLTLLFLGLFLLIYVLGGAAALGVFYHGLTLALDEELSDLSSEILPAIQFSTGVQSLKKWAAAAEHEHLTSPAGIQLFDPRGRLLEKYGISGEGLKKGELRFNSENRNVSLKSNYEELREEGRYLGFLQVQISTDSRDTAVQQFGLTMLLMLPILAVAVSFAGYFFSGLAIKPVEKSIKVLKTFVADAGHEFITPVTVVEASLQTLEEQLKEHNIGLEVLSMISRASQRMKDLASDLIFLAKLDNPDAQLPVEIVSLDEIVEPAMEEVQELARSKGITLSCSHVPELPIYGHRHSLQVMITNLLTNGVKYTEPGGSVKLDVGQDSNRIVLIVEDSGIGIPSDRLENIFERFYRVDESRSRAQGGSGLGLAIVKAILDRHKSEIEVQSTLGKGSKFIVRIPIANIPVQPLGKFS